METIIYDKCQISQTADRSLVEIPTPNLSDQAAGGGSARKIATTVVHTIPNMLASFVARRSVVSFNKTAFRFLSVWSAVPAGPPDPILGMSDSSHTLLDVPPVVLTYLVTSRCYRSFQGRQ